MLKTKRKIIQMTKCITVSVLSILSISYFNTNIATNTICNDNHMNMTVLAVSPKDMTNTSIVSDLQVLIDNNIELNNANMIKANTEPELEIAYKPIIREHSLSVLEREPAYVEAASPESKSNEGYTTTIKGLNIYVNPILNPNWDSTHHITPRGGVYKGPSGKETYYNLPMGGVVKIMRNIGFTVEDWPYWEREDGCKMFGDYIMVAADLSIRPRGSLIETSMGTGIVCDTGEFIYDNPTQIDIAVNWK